MTTATGKQLAVGLRYVSIYELNASGRPLATSPTVPYVGIQAEGGKTFTLTIPQPRKINHPGDDRLLQVDTLPSLEGPSAELHLAKGLMSLNAKLSGIKVSTIGESVGILYDTDQQGYEPQVGVLMYQQSLDADQSGSVNGARRWRGIWMPKARLILQPHGMDENPSEMVYQVTPFIVSAHLWGPALTLSTDGSTTGAFEDRMYEGKPVLDSWLADGIATVFTLSQTAFSTAKVTVYNNGVLVSSGLTVTTTTVTFSVAPVSGHDIDILYEF